MVALTRSTARRAQARGPAGITGAAPAHEWDGPRLRFRNPDLSWAAYENLLGPEGPSGAANNFVTRAQAEAAIVGAGIEFIRILRYETATPVSLACFVRMGSAPGTPTRAHVQTLDGAWWVYAPQGYVDPYAFGARGDNTQCEADAFDDIVVFAGSRKIYAQGGAAGYRFDRPLAASGIPVNIEGDGHGQSTSPGTLYNSLGTTFLLNFTSGYLFNIDHSVPGTFRGILFRGVALPMVAGGALYFTASTPGLGTSPIIQNCAFALVYRGVHVHKPSDPHINERCIFNQWIDKAIYFEADGIFEGGGGDVSTNEFIGYISGIYGVYAECAYVKIHHNRIVGLPAAFAIISDGHGPVHSAGAFEVSDNQIEEQTNYGTLVTRTSANDFASMPKVNGNQYSNITNTGLIAHIAVIDAVGGDWIDSISITDNIMRSTLGNSSTYIQVATGRGVTVSGNEIKHFGSGTAVGVGVKGASLVAPAFVHDNRFDGLVGLRYDISSAVHLIDLSGMTFAQASAIGPANGSMIYVTDGAPNGNPLAGSSNGAIAKRLNGIWRSD